MSRSAVMLVLRAALGVGLGEARALLGEVLAGDHSGTVPEMEFLARKLRAAGIETRVLRRGAVG
ncbi:hypothetical protein [Streptomyces sp. NBC_01465]|uniref:hypothetical protein n=1 Tax=Streptomyces sp. NBC_01465 TaxID=2903878 RepID=UPI002E341E9D|nr:hypothetical protein [Streptomyces sp. NBC_01465]